MNAPKSPSFRECPGGHKLPAEGCTPLYCRDSAKGRATPPPTAPKKPKAPVPKKAATALAKAEKEAPAETDDLKAKLEKKIRSRVEERAMRMALLKMPTGLTGAEAEEWADRKTVDLIPIAVAQIEFDLLYGDDSQRREAARDILDMTGRRRRDSAGAAPPTIVLNLGAGSLMPWEKNEKVTAGTVTRVEAKKIAADGDGPHRTVEVDGGRDKTGA